MLIMQVIDTHLITWQINGFYWFEIKKIKKNIFLKEYSNGYLRSIYRGILALVPGGYGIHGLHYGGHS